MVNEDYATLAKNKRRFFLLGFLGGMVITVLLIVILVVTVLAPLCQHFCLD